MIKTRIASAVATSALLVSMITPAFAADITVTGNGSGSVNTANVTDTNTTSVSQTNNAVVTNNVTSNSNSGGNSANFNTGGSTTVVSGPAKSTAEVTTAVNANHADVTPCNCENGGTDVKISGNGATSFNTANVNGANTTTVGQTNAAAVSNSVASNANSGNNGASFNTGGTTVVQSGLAQSSADVTTAANVNTAKVGGHVMPGAGANNASEALISGNGAGSLNNINLNLASVVALGQSNSASIANDVVANANSGLNSADFNTGGAVAVVAGPAMSSTTVDNLANFNAADLDCGCITSDVNAKIAGNGAGFGGFNTINANLASVLGLSQGNLAGIGNSTGSNADSGLNSAGFNTGSPTDDPAVVSLGSQSTTSVSNLANWNDAGTGATVSLPGGNSLSLLMDFSAVWSLLHMI